MARRVMGRPALGIGLAVTLILVSSLAVTGCVGGDPGSGRGEWAGHTLKVAVWSGPFIDNFQRTVVDPFEELTGADVLLSGHWGEVTAQILAAPADNPPYDIIFGESMIYTLARTNDLLVPLNLDNIPNAVEVWEPVLAITPLAEGYGVPFDFGHNVPVFIPDQLGFELSSWKDLLRPEMAGKVALSRPYWVENLYMAALIMDEEPGPGEIYTDLDSVYERLAEMRGCVGLWYEGGADCVAALVQGEVLVANYYMEYVFQPELWDLGVRAVVPEEGGTGYMDYFMVVRGSGEQELAELFIDFAVAAEQETAFAALHFTQPVNRNAVTPEQVRGVYASTDEGWRQQMANLVDYGFFVDRFNELHERYIREILHETGGGE